MKQSPYDSYRQNSIQTASPGRLILMLFDGALRLMSMAVKGFEEQDFLRRNETIHLNLIKTQAILDELNQSLDHDKGGEFARNMSELYEFMREQLRKANVEKDRSPIEVVMKLLGEIRGAWSSMLEQLEGQGGKEAWTATAA